MINRRLTENRFWIVCAVVALVIAYCVLLTRVRTVWVNLAVFQTATALAVSALLGYPFVVAAAYAGTFLKRETAKWFAIWLYLVGAFWGLAFIVIILLGVIMTAASTFDIALRVGSAAVILAMLISAGWAIAGGNVKSLLSWKVAQALLLATVVLFLWWGVRETGRSSWAGEEARMGAFYVGLVALFSLSAAAATQFTLERLKNQTS